MGPTGDDGTAPGLRKLLDDVFADPEAQAAFEDQRERDELWLSLVKARGERPQRDVAAAMGTTQSAVSDLEQGKVDPRISTLQRYARAVGRTLQLSLRSPREAFSMAAAAAVADSYWTASVLRSLYQGPAARQTPPRVANRLGLPEEAVDMTLSHLVQQGWITRARHGLGESGFSIRKNRALAIGVSVTRGGLLGVLTDLDAARAVNSVSIPLDDSSPTTVVRQAAGLVKALRSDLERPDASLLGLGVCLAGLVDGPTGTVQFAPDLASDNHPWKQVPLEAELEKATGLRTVVENDANALAIREHLRDPSLGSFSVILLSRSGEGVGAGIISDGRIVRGSDGSAGEIGHLIVRPGISERCRCGRAEAGCLEMVSSVGAIARRVNQQRGLASTSLAEALQAIVRGDRAAISSLEDSAYALGTVISYTAAILGSARVYLVGPDALVEENGPVGQLFMDAIKGCVRRSLELKTEVLGRSLQVDTEALAAAAVAVNHFLDRPLRWDPSISPRVEQYQPYYREALHLLNTGDLGQSVAGPASTGLGHVGAIIDQ